MSFLNVEKIVMWALPAWSGSIQSHNVCLSALSGLLEKYANTWSRASVCVLCDTSLCRDRIMFLHVFFLSVFMQRVAQLMSFPQPASEKQARKKSNEMEWESSLGGADGQSVAPPGSRSVLHDQQEAVWLAAELLVRPGVRAAGFWEPPFLSTSKFSRIDLECKRTHRLTSGGDFLFFFF